MAVYLLLAKNGISLQLFNLIAVIIHSKLVFTMQSGLEYTAHHFIGFQGQF